MPMAAPTILLTVALAGSLSAGEWAFKDCQYRRQLIVEEAANFCAARFSHRGTLKDDARDLRVTDSSGKPLNHELIRLGPGDQVHILFESPGAQNGAAYWVYFGNSKAPKPGAWIAQAGVVLEVRTRAAGGCDSWKEFKKMFDDSKELQGRVLRTRIFEGYNPCGPNQEFVSHYRAFFDAPKAGDYVFATNSDDASFLLVDGKMVAEYPGWHGGWEGRFGNHNGRIQLSAGVHKLDYYHVQSTGECGTTAGWQPPGGTHLVLMPDNAFVKVGRAKAAPLETVSGARTLDFNWTALDHLVIEGCYLLRYTFECESAYNGALVFDFNDGSKLNLNKTKDKLIIRHGFLKPGTYTVTLAGKDASVAECKQTVVVEPVWSQREDFEDGRWREYREGLSARLENHSVRAVELLPLLTFARAQNDHRLSEMCAAEAWRLAREIPASDHAQVFLAIGLQLQRTQKDYGQANSALQEASKGEGDKQAKAQAKLHRAGLLLHYFGQDPEALDLLKSVDDADLTPEQVTLKQIYLADAYAGLGKREEAVKRYDALRKVVPLTDRAYAVGRRGRFLTIRNCIRTGDYEMALQELQNIEWETPQERMADDTGVLRAECYLAQKDYQRAAVLLCRLLKVNPTSAKVPEMRLLLMKAYKGLSRKDMVEDTYGKLKKDSPYATETALAAELLRN